MSAQPNRVILHAVHNCTGGSEKSEDIARVRIAITNFGKCVHNCNANEEISSRGEKKGRDAGEIRPTERGWVRVCFRTSDYENVPAHAYPRLCSRKKKKRRKQRSLSITKNLGTNRREDCPSSNKGEKYLVPSCTI